MSLELVNTAVLFPEVPNWASPPKWSRQWTTEVVAGATGAEDRASARSTPKVRISYQALVDKPSDRTLFAHRARTALKTGRACAAHWGIQGAADVEFSETGVAIHTKRTWTAGQWILIARPDVPMRNRSLYINCGGSAVTPWVSDRFYDVGANRTTASAINVSAVTDPAPEAVYQSAREIITVNAFSTLIYTLRGWTPGIKGLVRLHFAEIDPNMNGTYQRKMNIDVRGSESTTWTDFEIYASAGALNKAHILEAFCEPGPDGIIRIKINGVYPHIEGVPSVFYYPALINAIEVHQNSYAARQITVGGTPPLPSISWSGRLKSRFPKNSIITPLIFGQFSTPDLHQITDEITDLPEIVIEEPMAETSTIGVAGSCPAEVEFDYPLVDDPGDAVIAGTRLYSSYVWGLNESQHPNEYLLSGQITHSILLLNSQPPGGTPIKYFWFYSPGALNNFGTAVQKWESSDTTYDIGDLTDDFAFGWYLGVIV